MALEQFHYSIGKSKITLPLLGNLPVGIVRKTRKIEDKTDQFFTMLELMLDARDLEVVDTLAASELSTLMEAWQDASGVTLGESTAS